jgi:hypothetical protein
MYGLNGPGCFQLLHVWNCGLPVMENRMFLPFHKINLVYSFTKNLNMKKLFTGMAVMLFSLVVFATPNEKVLSNFAQSFPKADSVKWYENENDYEVHFYVGQTRCLVWYDKDGVVTKSIRYYLQNMLSPMVLASVQRKYKDQSIFGVTEVTNQDGVQYYLVLEDDKKWYNITSDAVGNLTLTKKFNKG